MFWLNLLILILIVAGHTELLVTIMNRFHSVPIARRVMKRLRRLENVLMVGFPLFVVWSLGLTGPAVLKGGSWTDLSVGWRIYLAVCACGCAGLCWSILRWSWRPSPAVQISNHSRVVDVARKLGRKPLGPGRFRFLASLPGNQSFQVQVSDKRYCLPHVPREWHELSILHLTDSHFIGTVERPFFDEVAALAAEMSPDLIVFTGDLLDDLRYLRWLPETFGRLKAPLGCYYSLGNHDWYMGPRAVRAEFERCGWQGVGGRVVSVEHRGHRLEIGGTDRPWIGDHPPFPIRDPREDATGTSPAFRLLLSHTPDYFAWARAHGVDLMLSGHIHGGQIVLPVIGPVFAPSRHGVRYASGPYWAEPTLLYVSRGLSGRQPLRFNCLPELTQIVLESPACRPSNPQSASAAG